MHINTNLRDAEPIVTLANLSETSTKQSQSII